MRTVFISAEASTLEKEGSHRVTIIVDDAGSGDLLFGVIIGAFRVETAEFKYNLVDVKFFQSELYCEKRYLSESTRITTELTRALDLKPDEEIHLCQGYIFDGAAIELCKIYGEERIKRIRVVGEAQRLTEIAYLDEIRNLGYEPLQEREEKRAKSFFHMMHWLQANPERICYAKTGWPRLKRYRLFKPFHDDGKETMKHKTVCSECGIDCEVPFKPDPHRPVYCKGCYSRHSVKKKQKTTNGTESKTRKGAIVKLKP